MDELKIRELNKQIKEVEESLNDNYKLDRCYEILSRYEGEDAVVPSYVIRDAIKEENKATSYLTKIPKLDKLIGGFKGGQLVTVSAPTGQGKTLFCQDLTRRFQESKLNCLWFSYEVGYEELFERVGDSVPDFYLPKKVIGSSIDWLKMRILEGIAKSNIKFVFIDHLHYLLGMDDLAKVKNLSLYVGMVMRELKKIAINTKTTIFLISHMRKSQLEKTPTIEDLRDSSFIAQESDLVLMIWRLREKEADGNTHWTNKSRLIVEKNRRTGNLGMVELAFNKGRFEEVMKIDYETDRFGN